MAVQLPTIQRMDVPDPSPEGRLEARAPSADQAMGAIRAGVDSVGNALVSAIAKFENDAIDTEVTNAVNQYDQWYRRKLQGDSETGEQGLVHFEGDPTELYNNFDQEANAKQNEFLEKSTLSHKGQQALVKALNNRHNTLYASRLAAYGGQYDKYQAKVFDSAVRLEKMSATNALQFINPKDTSSLIPLEATVGRMGSLRIRHAIKMGTAEPVEAGTPGEAKAYETVSGDIAYATVSPSVQLDLSKDASETFTNVIQNAIANDDYDKAKVLMNTFRPAIDPVNVSKLDAGLDQLFIKNAAHNALAKAEGATIKQKRDLIKSMTAKELEVSEAKAAQVKLEARKLIDTTERLHENQEDRRQKVSFRHAFNHVTTRMNGGDTEMGGPYVNVYEMQNDPAIKGILPSLTPSQQKTLYELASGKDIESDPYVRIKMDNMLATESFWDMDAAALEEQMLGLSRADKEMYRNLRRNFLKDTPSTAASRADKVFKTAEAMYNIRAATKDGVLLRSAKEDWFLLRSEIAKELGTLPQNFKPEELEGWVEKTVREFVRRRAIEKDSFYEEKLKARSAINRFLGKAAPVDEREVFMGQPYVGPPDRTKAQGFQSRVEAPRTSVGDMSLDAPITPSATATPSQPVSNKRVSFAKLSQPQILAVIDTYKKETGNDLDPSKREDYNKLKKWYDGRQ